MRLTDEQVSYIATWAEIQAGFGRDDPATAARIEAIVAHMNASGTCRAKLLASDGLSNYFVLNAIPSVPAWSHLEPFRKAEGFLIYLSACAPVGVVSHAQFVIDGEGFVPMQLDRIVDPDQLQGPLAECVGKALRLHGYELLTKVEVEMPLPEGVVPWEYCAAKSPWNRRFHALFANTD